MRKTMRPSSRKSDGRISKKRRQLLRPAPERPDGNGCLCEQPQSVKARGIIVIISLALAALFICFMGWACLWGRREPWARIRFTEVRYTNGTVSIVYRYTLSSGAVLHETGIRDGVRIIDCVTGGHSLFGWPISGSGNMGSGWYPSEIAGEPSWLVETGRAYNLNVRDPLILYEYTNKSGMRYQGQFILK